MAEKYKNVIATDTSPKQLEFAPALPNVRYECTPPKMSIAEVEQRIAPNSSVDLVTIAQAMHWFDLPIFYKQVKCVLKKPNGVIAAWCYKLPEINQQIDTVLNKFVSVDADPYLDPQVKLIFQKYETIEFPFEPVDGLHHTGAVEFKSTMKMDLDRYLTYIRSWSAYQTAQRKGVELLSDEVMKDFTRAWNEDGVHGDEKTVTFPIYLRIGKVGNLD